MPSNKVLERGTSLQVAVPVAAAVKSGDLLLLGTVPMVANENDGDTTRPSRGYISTDSEGVFLLSVLAVTTISPAVGSAVVPGDKIFATGGTSDATTGVTYGATLCKVTTGTLVGIAISVTGASGNLVSSAATATIAVRLNGAAS